MLIEVASPEELGELFKSRDVELEDGLTLEEAYRLVKEQEEAELNEEELEDVNGGFVAAATLNATRATFVVDAGMLIFIAGYEYQKYKSSKRKNP